ncbi:type II membrane protein [Didymella sp. IMI 355093]|nr:type II membrane protein [Didymella sp. IMI 355093]
MAPSRSQTTVLSLLAATSILPLQAWASFECKDMGTQGTHFNFEKLGGPHVVHWKEEDVEHDMEYKYNFTLDLCKALKSECHNGARVCGMRENVDLSQEGNSTTTPIDIAGTYTSYNGRNIDAKYELLRNSKSNSDAGREGLRTILHGGRLPFDDKKNGLDQRAIIEFVCDKERTGLEGDETDGGKSGNDKDDDKKDDKKDEDKKEEKRMDKREEGSKDQCEDSEASLRFCGYKVENLEKDKKARTLRLEWRTKYACEDTPAEKPASSHWGFFGWFFIILFLGIAAYLVFGSWLNYNRYGARGWDLLPHGDTIRDVPYIAKDFGRKIFQTVQGSGSRGGYAAV